MIRYRITAREPHAHLFEVSCTVEQPSPDGQRFRLPSWIPGSYLIREFARHVVRIAAACDGRAVEIVKEAKDIWRVAPCDGPLTVTMDVYAFDLSVRTAYFDTTRGFFNGTSVFLCPEGFADSPCEVDIVRPDGTFAANWRVATAMPRRGADAFGFGTYGAESYDALIDHPVEMSDFTLASFVAGGAEHHVAISGRHRADMARLVSDLQRVCDWQCRLFDPARGKAPFDRYVFLVAVVGEGYGGLEHRASTSLICKRDELPQPGMQAVTDDYRTFLGLASHEYFHSWNVKRIKPEAFAPYDLTRENYTRELWAYEGVTSYYDDLALVRSGVLSITDYLELLGRAITTVARTPGRLVQSVAESSFDTWIKFYRPDENTPNAVVSYYAKGSLVALALDLTLRQNGTSLDDVMRALWREYGVAGRGVPERTIERLASELAKTDLTDFFTRHVRGAEDPPLATLLASFGVTLLQRAASGASDRGGNASAKSYRTWLGVKLAPGGELRVQHVYRGSAAEGAGLAAGDTLLAFDGLRASADALERLQRTRDPGESIEITAFRRDELMRLPCRLEPAPADTAWLVIDASASDEIRARRDAWLGQPIATDAPPD